MKRNLRAARMSSAGMNPMMRGAVVLLVASAIAAGAESDAATGSSDPAARGLDVFVHLPDKAAPLAMVPVQIEAFGFPTVTRLVPLAGASIEAMWDPEKLGPHVSSAPPAVKGTADAFGRIHLDVPMPEGDERALSLLVGVRSGEHRRTRAFTVTRVKPYEIALHASDTRVVPGGAVSAWTRVRSATTGEPVPEAPVVLELLEGGVARSELRLSTDAAGTAMGRVAIPFTDEPSWSYVLRARTATGASVDQASASVTLTTREETPGTPSIRARWAESSAKAGDRVPFTIRVRDALDQPVAALPVRYWIGPKGTTAPEGAAAWDKTSVAAVTDAKGEVAASSMAPDTVVQGVGTTLTIVAKTDVEGHDLGDTSVVRIEAPAATAELLPEAGSIVPGVPQRMMLRVLDGRGDPIKATFAVTADGLVAAPTTDEDGEAEVTWTPPIDVGALRNIGPCAGGVAAAVVVRWEGDVPALADRRGEPFALCLTVNRDAPAIVRVEPPIVRAGQKARVRIVGAEKSGAWSVTLRSSAGDESASAWIEDGARGGDVEVPRGARGAWTIGAVSPQPGKAARVAGGALVVAPAVLPTMKARIAEGRAAPGGSVEVDVEIADEKGRGLPGTVAAVMIDLHGGGSVAGLSALDTRRGVCRIFGVDSDRCDRFVEGDPALDALRRAELGARMEAPLAASNDPGGQLDEALRSAFADVVKSLEGAVFEATSSPDRLRDVRRRGPGGWTYNPELMTLVTAAMDPPPLTPGGEPLVLGDLLAIDPQVDFDHVARRITRLKLFRILTEMRAFRNERLLFPDEPALRDPGAMLRRLVRDGRLGEDVLIDPWGGTIQFTRSAGAPQPFLTITRGFELRAPGPDGVIGSGDDVRDPFERVLRSGSPYARAVQEDRIVDAKWDMEVGESTVSAWQAMFEELTGTSLGGGSGIGLGSVGTVGHGAGTGSGHGFGAGRGRLGTAITTGAAFWSAPQRTDDRGHARIHIPLGDAETTWRVAFVGVPDRATPATTTLDIASSVPLSARAFAGASWIEGDDVAVRLTVRNRSAGAVRATLAIAAGGAASLVDRRDAQRIADLAADGSRDITVRVRGTTAGTGWLTVTTRAPGLPDDTLRHEWEIKPPGQLTNLLSSKWIEGSADLAIVTPEGSYQRIGKPRLLLERGEGRALAAAIESLDPDRLRSEEALADAVEAGARVERWALARDGRRSPLAVRAGEVSRRALGKLAAFTRAYDSSGQRWAALVHASAWARASDDEVLSDVPACPPSHDPPLAEGLAGLEAEPAPTGGVVAACWDAMVSSTISRLTEGASPVPLARAVLALAERAHRPVMAAALTLRLREAVSLGADGAIVLDAVDATSRESRAIVYAALLRSAEIGAPSPAPKARLAAHLHASRDAGGGYGSAFATLAAVRAMLSFDAKASEEKSHVVVTAEGFRRELDLGATDAVTIPIDADGDRVDVTVRGPGVLAQLERLAVRRWSRGTQPARGPVRLEVQWPSDARQGKTGVVRLFLRHDLGRQVTLDTRLPLPPGVSLAEAVRGVRQVQGVLVVRTEASPSALPLPVDVPVRFALAGKVTIPEARSRVAYEEGGVTVAPAQPLTIR